MRLCHVSSIGPCSQSSGPLRSQRPAQLTFCRPEGTHAGTPSHPMPQTTLIGLVRPVQAMIGEPRVPRSTTSHVLLACQMASVSPASPAREGSPSTSLPQPFDAASDGSLTENKHPPFAAASVSPSFLSDRKLGRNPRPCCCSSGFGHGTACKFHYPAPEVRKRFSYTNPSIRVHSFPRDFFGLI